MQALRSNTFKVPLPPRWLMAGGGDEEPAPRPPRGDGMAAKGEDLPYRVEVFGEDHRAVEQTLAMTANGSIGYAAYYEATREYPDRYVVLRHKSRIVARWNPPEA